MRQIKAGTVDAAGHKALKEKGYQV